MSPPDPRVEGRALGRRQRALRLLLCVALTLPACTSTAPGPQAPDAAPGGASLYSDLGGDAGINAIVEAFLFRLADDARVNDFFVDTDIIRFRDKLVEHLCMLADGPCVYTGDSMARVHRGMGIDDADFNAVVEDLIEAMEELNVATGVQNRLLARLAPLYPEITYDGGAPPAP